MGISWRFWVDSSVILMSMCWWALDSLPGFLFVRTDLKPTFLLCRRDESLVVVFRQSESAKIPMNAEAGSTSVWWGHLRRPTKTKSKVRASCHICTSVGEARDLILLLGGGSRHSPSSMVTSSTAMSPSMPEPRIPSITIWKEDVGLMLTLACLHRSPWFPLRVHTDVSWPVWLFCLKYTFNVPICFPYMW